MKAKDVFPRGICAERTFRPPFQKVYGLSDLIMGSGRATPTSGIKCSWHFINLGFLIVGGSVKVRPGSLKSSLNVFRSKLVGLYQSQLKGNHPLFHYSAVVK